MMDIHKVREKNMKKGLLYLMLFLFLGGCSHMGEDSIEGSWFSTIEDIDFSLELEVVEDSLVTGGMEVIEDSKGEIEKGTVMDILEGSCDDNLVTITIDADMNKKKSNEDIFMKLRLGKEGNLMGYGCELRSRSLKQPLVFRRFRKFKRSKKE
jgi:hypothetical protein